MVRCSAALLGGKLTRLEKGPSICRDVVHLSSEGIGYWTRVQLQSSRRVWTKKQGRNLTGFSGVQRNAGGPYLDITRMLASL
jgi:hypothetical protein